MAGDPGNGEPAAALAQGAVADAALAGATPTASRVGDHDTCWNGFKCGGPGATHIPAGTLHS